MKWLSAHLRRAIPLHSDPSTGLGSVGMELSAPARPGEEEQSALTPCSQPSKSGQWSFPNESQEAREVQKQSVSSPWSQWVPPQTQRAPAARGTGRLAAPGAAWSEGKPPTPRSSSASPSPTWKGKEKNHLVWLHCFASPHTAPPHQWRRSLN